MSAEYLRPLIHYGIHFGIPIAVAWFFYGSRFRHTLLLLWAGILLDTDHLLASPVFDADRCSIGFHVLHSWPLIVLYMLLLLPRRTRIIGIACSIHILADMADCFLMNSNL
ncbi:DUF6122 family protein [Robertkochia flava]|uniref:DUF6122 family protein n=1 Tax=Robertkochia flava TaxID=3447986 RepID=UPI001CC9E2A4|nr:DUF6122 family protein [Robertkochia marina]